MHKTKIFFAISLLILSTLACSALIPLPDSNGDSPQSVQPSPEIDLPPTEADVPRVTVEEAKAAFDEGTAVIVDVRSRASYDSGHVVEALHIPLEEFESNISNIDLPIDQWIITYCT